MGSSYYETILNKQIGKKELLEKNKKKINKEVKHLKQKQIDIEKIQALFQLIAKQTQEKIRFHIEDIVQMALDACYFDDYEFRVNFEIRRGKTEADLIFVKDDQPVNPIDATGGGVVDITAFALRIAIWSLSKTDNVIIFDEPFKHLSRNLRSQAGRILKKLSSKLYLQNIIVTHDDEIINNSDKVFTVCLNKNKSIVKEKK
jgi:DNA repair exonuclease SbcCD ATPase subunit